MHFKKSVSFINKWSRFSKNWNKLSKGNHFQIEKFRLSPLRFFESRFYSDREAAANIRSGTLFKMAFRNRNPEQIQKITGCQVTVDDTGSRATVSLPGFTAADFDRTGNLSFQKLQSRLTSARFLAYHVPAQGTGNTFLEYDVMTRERFTFMASSETEVSRDYYSIPDSSALPELAVSLNLGYVGNSSLNSMTELRDKTTGKVFATNTNTVVSVDKATRKPTPLPDWWKDKYKSHVIGNKPLICPPLKVPDNHHKLKTTITWSDIDGYKHTNYIVYVRFCYDAAMDAIHHGYLTRFHDDVTLYLTRRMRALYKGESRAGQEVTVACWENPEHAYTLHFDISRDGETIFQCTLEFFEPVTE